MEQDEISTCLETDNNCENSVSKSNSNLEVSLHISEKYPIEDFFSYMHLICKINSRSVNLSKKKLYTNSAVNNVDNMKKFADEKKFERECNNDNKNNNDSTIKNNDSNNDDKINNNDDDGSNDDYNNDNNNDNSNGELQQIYLLNSLWILDTIANYSLMPF